MLLEATHRADGTRAFVENGDTPFLGFLEVPNAPVATSGGYPIYRVKGWIVSGRGRTIRVATRVGDAAWVEHDVDRERPEVVAALAADYPAPSPCCGFSFPLELPSVEGEVDLPVVVEARDGEFVGRAQFSIRHRGEPPPPRADYKTVWQSVSAEPELAKLAVMGFTEEDRYEAAARHTIGRLEQSVGIRSDDVALEIGAGVGRVGQFLAPRCGRWIATDVSPNMLRHARARCKGFDNTEFIEISGWDLAPIPSGLADLVYCTVVFMHLEEWERYSYVREAMRVLRPGGRLYVDNINLQSEPGWKIFLEVLDLRPLERPPNVSKTSTAEELHAYLERAGFVDIEVESPRDQWWVAAYGRSPAEKRSGYIL
jgi:ubiquinone/menaquinone biosynthesis C-methylase UbiE